MSTEKTVERKAETKNSISRLVFVALSILLEISSNDSLLSTNPLIPLVGESSKYVIYISSFFIYFPPTIKYIITKIQTLQLLFKLC